MSGPQNPRQPNTAVSLSAVNWPDVAVRVQSGHVFTPKALQALRQSCHQSSSPAHWLVLAHAFLNADLPAEAMVALDARAVDDRDDWLARARALVQLSRWRAAEPWLHKAHAAMPNDPEPLKALVLVALNQSDWRAARWFVDLAHTADPLDAETALLVEEVNRLSAFESSAEEDGGIRAAVAAALARRGLPFRVGHPCIWVKVADGRTVKWPFHLFGLQADRQALEHRLDEVLQMSQRATTASEPEKSTT
jgi:hypothetical protein